MSSARSRFIPTRRSFLRAMLPGGAFLCLGGPCLLRASHFQEKAQPGGPKHKFLEDSEMTFAEVFQNVYGPQVRILKGFEQEIGGEQFTAILKGITDRNVRREMSELAKKAGKNDLATFTEDLRKPNRFWQHALTFEVIEDTPKAYEVKVTECIWAKTLRGFNAGDLGYLLSCYGDYAAAEGFNPKMRMIRTKTLMQGDAFCNHRYVIEQ